MHDDILELYQQVILDHSMHPCNFGKLENPTYQAFGHNPICGDAITLFLQVKNQEIVDVKFSGQGCAICKASSSMMTQAILHKNISDILNLFHHFHSLLTDDSYQPNKQILGKLSVFGGVKMFPVRVKCASLAWHTLKAALQSQSETTTE